MIQQIGIVIITLCFCLSGLQAQNKDSVALKAIEHSDKVIIKRQQRGVDAMYDSVYQVRIAQKFLDGVYIPMDLFDCFRQLDTLMEPAVKERFMAFTNEEVDKRTHGSLGLWIDHKWKLTDGSRLSAYFRKMSIPHPDYMVGVIITTYHRHLHKKDLKVKELVQEFKERWAVKQKEMAKEMVEYKLEKEKSQAKDPKKKDKPK